MLSLTFTEALKLFAPVIFIQLALDIYCIINIFRKGVRNLNKPIWIFIVLCINFLGAIIYLAIGRRRWEND